jgi:hypothetical protein
LQARSTLGTDQVATGHKDDRYSSVQAHLTHSFLLQPLQLLLCIPSSWGLKKPPAPSGTKLGEGGTMTQAHTLGG